MFDALGLTDAIAADLRDKFIENEIFVCVTLAMCSESVSDMISLGVKVGTRKNIRKYIRSLYIILWTIRRTLRVYIARSWILTHVIIQGVNLINWTPIKSTSYII
jgi:hypothetical protein